ncbi:cryptochrome/photolyase family protein [Fimbriimonas ginsengisoli]|uniref:Deoxyribodipyrimidine photo-lyase n=1 Tax=Fimbriimonas ginsengisoli Gsoil 348 TaxID=661478 RepID=A0A068NVD8_FIMGI|nr:deoxyribodipyrimidine photo-lyase [Fimbriimonas ginsengisoli]AIE85534.1 deoxyribodipyrimidine photo-lyase [Fimbriimonas ginsengisoli Gsoil 348]
MPQPLHRSLCWLRRDLRLSDHAALAAATEASAYVAVVFVFDTAILGRLEDRDDRRVTFIYRSLQELDDRLRAQGAALLVRFGDPKAEMPALAREFGAEAVFAARDYEPYAVERDAEVGRRLAGQGAELRLVKDTVVREAGETLSHSGAPYRAYAHYARAWHSAFVPKQDLIEHLPRLERLARRENLPKANFLPNYPLAAIGFTETELWLPAGEAAANAQAAAFRSKIDRYEEDGNFPSHDGTSALSVHLRFGTISVRECFRLALEAAASGRKWLAELLWREHYQDVLGNFPRVAESPFDKRFESLRYPGDPIHFSPWQVGKTGYPIVDAAMRCLNATGWMPNRLRMVAASFLCKDLLLDYRLGERYFARKLLDFDLAANNGNWQWVASVGADSQPSFRVMNPVTQSERFDPNGDFIRRWVPELAALSASAIHFPCAASEMELMASGIDLGETYPRPIVDHARQRQRAIGLFKEAV